MIRRAWEWMRFSHTNPENIMTICTNYRQPGPVSKRYVRRSADGSCYCWCEQSSGAYAHDVAEGTCDAEDLPADVRAKCDSYIGAGYACEWPMSST